MLVGSDTRVTRVLEIIDVVVRTGVVVMTTGDVVADASVLTGSDIVGGELTSLPEAGVTAVPRDGTCESGDDDDTVLAVFVGNPTSS